MLKISGAAVATASILGLEACANEAAGGPLGKAGKAKKILVIGAHPDDPETGAGGTMMMLAKAGHDVTSVYMTRGERGIPGTAMDEAARIRTAEAEKACEVMGVKHIFMTQIDGGGEITPERYEEMHNLIKEQKPDIVITHWPIDSHRDHAICSALVLDAWFKMDHPFELYYFEVCAGIQAIHFFPTDFVDITEVRDKKVEATFCHVSQKPENWYDKEHGLMDEFRGMQAGVKYAEAFTCVHQNPSRLK
jgi:Uncharacterized proteins, LmbE homologs